MKLWQCERYSAMEIEQENKCKLGYESGGEVRWNEKLSDEREARANEKSITFAVKG